MPRQTVEARRNGEETRAKVGAAIRIFSNRRARSTLRVRTREDGILVFRAIQGRGVFDRDDELVHVELRFRQPDGQLATATVKPGAEAGCDIWDFLGSDVQGGLPSISFEARTEIRVQDANR